MNNNNENFGRLRVIKELAQGVNGLSLNNFLFLQTGK